MSFGQRIASLRKGMPQEEFAIPYGVSRQTVANWENGTLPNTKNLIALAKNHAVSLDWLVFDKGLAANDDEFVAIKRREVAASAGAGTVVEEELDKPPIKFRRDWLRSVTKTTPENLIVIQSEGASMAPTILNGDDLLVDLEQTNPRKEGIYIIQWDGVLNVKRLTADAARGLVNITSDNPHHPASAAVRPDEITIFGRVIWIGRKV